MALGGKTHILPQVNFPFEYYEFAYGNQFPKDFQSFIDNKVAADPNCLTDQPWAIMQCSHEPHGPHNPDPPYPFMKTLPEGAVVPPKWPNVKAAQAGQAGYLSDVEKCDREFHHFWSLVKKNFDLTKKHIAVLTSDHGADAFGKWSCYNQGPVNHKLSYRSPFSKWRQTLRLRCVLLSPLRVLGAKQGSNSEQKSLPQFIL